MPETTVLELTAIPTARTKTNTSFTNTDLETASRNRTTAITDSTLALIARTSQTPVRTEQQIFRDRIQFSALCLSLFLVGWNDGSAGPLLPVIQKTFDVGFTIVSLLFVFSCAGFMTGGLFNVFLTNKLAFGKLIVLGSSCQATAYAIKAPAVSFPLLCLGYFINGFGMSLQEANANAYVASMGSGTRLGWLHAVYGAGALLSPLAATEFSRSQHWSFHYLVSLAIAVLATVVMIVVFQGESRDECLAAIGQSAGEKGSSEHSAIRQIYKLKAMHTLALFLFVYTGIEATMGGWIVTYITEVRHGGISSGYISAGFFGGQMIGRVALLEVNKKLGERNAVLLYGTLAILLELTVWFVPSLIGNAIAVAIIGVLTGPMFPLAMNQAARVLPPWLLTACVGWIGGFGSSGGAFFPLAVGLVAAKAGIASLQPILVGTLVIAMVLWALVPTGPRRLD